VQAAQAEAEDGDATDRNGESIVAALPALRPQPTDEARVGPSVALPQLRPRDPPPPTRIVGADDYFALRRIITLMREESLVAAQSLARELEDPLAKKMAEWLYVRDSSLHAGIDRIVRFVTDHPDWPSNSLIRRRAEATFFVTPQNPQTVIDYFAGQAPRSGIGKAALARALLKTGMENQAANLIRSAWHENRFSKTIERLILRDFSELLREEDHLIRLHFLLYQNQRKDARRAARLAGSYGRSLLKAHNSIGRRTSQARRALGKISEDLKKDPVLLLRQAQVLRRSGKNVEAAAFLVAASGPELNLVDGNGWWPERRLLVRRMLTAARPDLAHKLAARHNVSNPVYKAEAEFLAGWVALRYLYDADLAYFHFRQLRQSVTLPLSIARAEYWLGRTEERRGNHASAVIRYANAEDYRYTFYGQLAMTALGRGDIVIDPPVTPTAAERKQFSALEITRAARLFHDLSETYYARLFLVQNARNHDNDAIATLSAELAISMGRPDTALRVGKAALIRNMPAYHAAHTLRGLPAGYDQVSNLEPALVYAVSRQESAFNFAAISHAGARGLMQLMPPTAREVSNELQIEYSLARLTQDPHYNVTLGATYLEWQIERFTGSYVMAIPAYNAGGGRVSRWTNVFGDPRDPLVDPIDWIERMPLSEPRDYVQRVLANLQIYRAILAGGRHPLMLLDDLARGKPAPQ